MRLTAACRIKNYETARFMRAVLRSGGYHLFSGGHAVSDDTGDTHDVWA
jgi:hypothetical protein